MFEQFHFVYDIKVIFFCEKKKSFIGGRGCGLESGPFLGLWEGRGSGLDRFWRTDGDAGKDWKAYFEMPFSIF